MIEFTFSEEQDLIRRTVRDFVEKEVKPLAPQIDETKKIPSKLIEMAKELGLFGIKFPEEYGGAGAGETGYCIACEELGHGCGSLAALIGAHQSIGATAIYLAGSEAQKRKYLVPLAQGRLIGAYALTEPGAGSDAANISTTAVRYGNEWVINGQKIWITNGSIADVLVVYTVTDKRLRARGGITAFIVERDFKGFKVGRSEDKMGIRASDSAQLFFEDMRVPNENVLGKVGEGFKVAMETLDHGRLSLAANCIGASKEVLDMSIGFAKQRVQFGRPIAEQEAIQWMIAEMAASIYAMESIVYRTAWMADRGMRFSRESAIVKMLCSEAADEVIDKALQIHGGSGYMREYQIERFYRDARVNRIFEGTNEIQRLVIARDVLKKGRY
jgi:alkylation response protein AidB-like acyl-CoA dehydrogenase